MTTPSTPSIDQQPAATSRAAPPDLQGWPKFWLYLILATVSILNAGWILSEAGVTFSRCFAPNDTHRRQAAAMLDGHFWLSRSIFDTQFDNCYVNGKVQQVWGLGVPMYLIPFELFGRAIGVSPFPDRIAMGVMLAAFFFYCGTLPTALQGRAFTWVQGAGMMVLIAFSPPLLNLLLNGPQNVYEDASVYALLTSLAIFIAMLRFIARRHMRDYWICCFLGGMSALVRPTHGIYGVLGPAICCVLLLRGLRVRAALIPLLLLVAGFAFLAVSNRIRFGAFAEFGHKETLTTARGEMTSRFVNPISAESRATAGKELLGALFAAPADSLHADPFGTGIFPGQAECFRWRDFYVTSYDLTLALLLVAGAAAGFWCLAGRALIARHRQSVSEEGYAGSLLLWSSASSAVLFAFMLDYPGLCARYLYDFWPGFLGFAVLAWLGSCKTSVGLSAVLLVSWLSFQFYHMGCRNDLLVPGSFGEVRRTQFSGAAVHRLKTDGLYDTIHLPPPRLTHFCDLGGGKAGFEMRLPVDSPAFVELLVQPREQSETAPFRADTYRARIAQSELSIASIWHDPRSPWVHVRFAVPPEITRRMDDELLFVCFAGIGDEADQQSERWIRSVRWR